MREYDVEIINLIRSDLGDEELKDELLNYHENDIALILEELEVSERLRLYRILGDDVLSEIFSYLDDPQEYLTEMGLDHAADVIEEMDSDDAIDVLENLEDEHKDLIMDLIEPEAKEDIELINSYDEDEVGSIMTTNFITIDKNMTVKQAMRKLIKDAAENDNVSLLYVLNEDETYYGVIELKELFKARAETPLDDIIELNYPVFDATEHVSELYDKLKDYDLDSYGVLDESKKLIGVITKSDVIEIVEQELHDDYAKLAGLTEDVEEDSSIWKSVRKRLPWLITLMILGLVVSVVISAFETVISSISIVVFFQAMVLGMSGNVGTQSLATTVRVLSDSSLEKKEIAKVVWKETRVGFCNGCILAVIGFVLIGLFIGFTQKEYGFSMGFAISGVIALSLICSMSLSSMFGSLIPIIFKKIHIDPAVASGPFITTLNDIVAVVCYYGLSWLIILGVILHG